MKHLCALAPVIAAVIAISVQATVIHIPGDYDTIQEGIDASSDGDTVLVHPGTYYENINFNGHNIVVGSLYLTTGDTAYIPSTIIDADSSGRGVAFESGEDSTTILTGFTIQHGHINLGAGILCMWNSCPVIAHNIIANNSAYFDSSHGTLGGGIYCYDSNPIIDNNIISDNIGGGICCGVSDPRVTNNTISRNIACGYLGGPNYIAASGGGFNCSYSNPIIVNNTICDNFATDGGGIYLFHSNGIITGNRIIANDGGGIDCGYSCPIIENNTIHGNISDDGGGIMCIVDSSPEIKRNLITGNRAWDDGGGIRSAFNSSPIILYNTISGNSALDGGGIHCSGFTSIPIITNNLITSNMATHGAGIWTHNAEPHINANTISANLAASWGGGIVCDDNDPDIMNNLIVDNWVQAGGVSRGGAIYCQNANPSIINNTITQNFADTAGGICCFDNSSPSIVNSILWGDSASEDFIEIYADSLSMPQISYSDIMGDYPGIGNVDLDPNLRDPNNDDFHLMAIVCGDSTDSPLIDLGSPSYQDSLIDCWHGLGTFLCDMGAFGGHNENWQLAVEERNRNHSTIPQLISLCQNYPNPFNSETIIRYRLPHPSLVKLSVYNILGQKIADIDYGKKVAGEHTAMWNGKTDFGIDVASGIYFYRLETGDFSQTQKMLLLR